LWQQHHNHAGHGFLLQGIECSILTVEYPLAPEHPFPAGLNAAADAIHWLLHDSGETADYFVGEFSCRFPQQQQQQVQRIPS
jgi:acetyl esterase/lipase